MADRDDEELVTRLQQRDKGAFATLLGRHDAALRRAARNFVSTSASADEVVQDTWVAVLDGLGRFERRSSIKSWIFAILVNRARTRGAREARTVPISAIGDDEGPADPERGPSGTDESETPSKLLLRKELAAALETAILDLPERQRRVVMLRDALGWSPEDVCNALALNQTNQRVLLHRARSRLRARLVHYHASS